MNDCYTHHPTNRGYVVARLPAGMDATPETIEAHRQAVFVDESTAADYCRYRNAEIERWGTDELPQHLIERLESEARFFRECAERADRRYLKQREEGDGWGHT